MADTDARDRKLSFAVCFQLSIVGIKNALVQAVPVMYENSMLLNYILLAVLLCIYLFVFVDSIYRFVHMRPIVFLVLLIVLTSFAVSPLISLNNTKVIMEWIPRTLPYCIITYMLIAELRSFHWIEYYMTRYCYIILVFCAVSALVIQINGHAAFSPWETYSMPLSYSTLISAMWLLYKYCRDKKIYDAILFFAGLFIIVGYGSRNPLLAIGAYIIYQIIKSVMSYKVSMAKKLFFIIIILLIPILVLFHKDFLRLLSDFFGTFHIESRTLNLLSLPADSSIDFSSGRDAIHAEIIRELLNRPLLGLGLGGDAGITGDMSHGLFLSLLSTYGFVLGGVSIFALLMLVLRSYTASSQYVKEILMVYICLVIPRGFTSIDVWTYDVFWWMLGVCTAAVYNRIYKETSSSGKGRAYAMTTV